MPSAVVVTLLLVFAVSSSGLCFAQGNPEDLPISDQPVPPTNASPAQAPATTPVPPATDGMITVPRAVWEQLLRDVEELKRKAGTAATPPSSTPPTTPPSETPSPLDAPTPSAPAPAGPPAAGNRSLLLPDISLVLQARGKYSSDRRDGDRNTLRLSEGELSIQGYVYPNVKADAFIVAAPAEDEAAQFEEAYLTFLGLRKGLNLKLGRKFTPFGRTGQQHTHSWLYARQLLPFRNLVAEEALVGDGVNLSYALPTKGKLFANLDVGMWTGEGSEAVFNTTDPSDPFFGDVPMGSGAAYDKRFYTARLWLGHPIGDNGELEVGGSYARGRSHIGDDAGASFSGHTTLTGADISYRRFLSNNRRLLLRGEYFRHQPGSGLPTNRASGHYLLGNYRLNKANDVGVLLERSGFPQAPGARESATSLIFTRQFTEQFYARLQATHGRRPGPGSYNEAWLQFVWGLGPHTHSIE